MNHHLRHFGKPQIVLLKCYANEIADKSSSQLLTAGIELLLCHFNDSVTVC